MDSNKFRNELKNIYIKYPEFVKAISNYSNNYLKFLYMHLSENIKIEISSSGNSKKNMIETKKIKTNKKFSESIIIIYKQFLTDDEKNLLKSNKDYNIHVYEEKYEEKGSKEYFLQKNRRDFLIPCFFNNKTIEFLEKINKENIPTFQNENTPKILGYNVYKFLKTRFIPKHPINKKPIPNNSFLDTTSESTKNHFCYAVRAVFLIDNKELEGPLSQVICLN